MPIHVETITPLAGLSFRLLRWRDNLREVEQFTADGRVSPFEGAGDHWHLHREMELTFIERGSGLLLVGDHIAQLHGPELTLLGAHLPHCIRGLTGSTGISMQFHWPLEHPVRAFPEFVLLEPLWERARRGRLFGAATIARIRPLLAALPDSSAAARLGLLLQILAALVAAPPSQMTVLSKLEFAVQEGERHQAGIGRVIRRVLEEYAEPLPLSEALGLAGMSKASFERQFPRYTGCTFTAFLNRVRLDHARQLLLGSVDSISTIAYATGFNHLSHFNRLYRRRFGQTPSADRARDPHHSRPVWQPGVDS
jgi:AraC-like DNA-binding protein